MDYCAHRQSDTVLILGRHEDRPDSREVSVKKLGVCEGDCRSHNDCADGLYCYERAGNQVIPGCDAGGVRGANYCYDPKRATCTSSGTLELTASDCHYDTFIETLNTKLESEGCEHSAIEELKLLLGTRSTTDIQTKLEQLCRNQIYLIDTANFKDFDTIASEEKNTVFTKAYFNGGTDWNDLDLSEQARADIADTYENHAQKGGIWCARGVCNEESESGCDLGMVVPYSG